MGIDSAERAPMIRRDNQPGDAAHEKAAAQRLRQSTPEAAVDLREAILQAKMSVGPAGDAYEREADDVAARVVRTLRAAPPTTDTSSSPAEAADSNPRVQRSGRPNPDHGGDGSGDGDTIDRGGRLHRVQRSANASTPPNPVRRIQRAATGAANIGLQGGDLDADTTRVLRASRGGGKPLPDPARSKMESAFGADFSGIRVHSGPTATDLNERIQAKAFTTGNDIYFRDSVPDASTSSGQELLAHELTHTIQQGAAKVRRASSSTSDSRSRAPTPSAITPTASHGKVRLAQTAGTIRRSEQDAVNLANQHDPGQAYATWGDLTAARVAARVAITTNWKAIADAYVLPPSFDGMTHPELIHQANQLVADVRHWSEPQARREAEALLGRLVSARAQILTTASRPGLAQMTAAIDGLKNHFLMPVRSLKAGWLSQKFSGGAAQTSLDMPGGGRLELFNSKDPTTGLASPLGSGGAGYGKHGRFADGANPPRDVFVKKQRMRKNETEFAKQRNGTPLFEHQQDLMASNLGYVQEEQEKFRAEVILAMALDHVNIGKTYAGAISVGKGGSLKGYTVQEMITGGDLKKAIAKNGTAKALTNAQKVTLIKGALDGLAHLHAHGYVHRDIKPENIMIAGDGTAKLIDFGESRVLDVNGRALTDTRAGTQGYYHPDITNPPPIAGQSAGTIAYSVRTDLWALRTTFEELGCASAGFAAWCATFMNPGQTAAALSASANHAL